MGFVGPRFDFVYVRDILPLAKKSLLNNMVAFKRDKI